MNGFSRCVLIIPKDLCESCETRLLKKLWNALGYH